MEPDFIYQTAEPMDVSQRREWIRERYREAGNLGATWHRTSFHPDDNHLILVESWKIRPKDEGEARWQLGRATQKTSW